jgi:ribosomal protein S18 acetylase RimI-like enzyme
MVVQYRKADQSDIAAMAEIRAKYRGTPEYWEDRISGYLNHKRHPQHALMPRVMYVAVEADNIAGFIAGHLTERLGCNGELEWIDTMQQYQRQGIASGLLRLLARWFVDQKSLRVCIDVDPANGPAQLFYRKHGAENLNEHWLFWQDISVVLKAG